MSEKNAEILLYLKTKFDLWMGAHEGRNLSILARRTGQAYTYIWRIYHQEANIEVTKITPVLDEVCTPEQVIEFYNLFFKDIAEIATRYYQFAVNMNKTNPGKAKQAGELKEYLRDPSYFHIIALCSSDKGISQDSLINQLGSGALELINELVEKELLVKSSEAVLSIDGHIFFDDQATRLSAMKSAIDIFVKRKTGVHSAIETNYFKIEPIRAIENKLKELETYIDQLRNDPTAKGNIPFCYLAALGRIDFPSNHEDVR